MREAVEASRAGVESSLKIGATVGVIGILSYSCLMLTFADIIIELANGQLFLTILRKNFQKRLKHQWNKKGHSFRYGLRVLNFPVH